MPKITKRLVDTLKPSSAGKDVFVWDEGDGSLKGFGIRIKPSGSAAYFVQYRNKEGRTRRLVLGKVTVLAAEEARVDAKLKLAAVQRGEDPSAERHAIRQSITVSDLCDLYIQDVEGRIKPTTLKNDKSRIECHVKPLLGRKTVRSLRIEDLEKFQLDVANGKTAKARTTKGRSGLQTGGRGVAARSLGMLGTVLEFAKRRRIITDNPARSVRKFEDKKDNRYLSWDEISALGKIMREHETENATGIAIVRALLLTGCRKQEIQGLPWDWLDLEAKCVRFKDTKTGAQMRVLGEAAIQLLKSQPKSTNNPKWVFPSEKEKRCFVGTPKVFMRLCQKAKIENIKLHSLRHTFASVAAEMGYTELTIAGLIGHSKRGVTARYAHIPDAALLSAADNVSSKIADALDGKIDKPKHTQKSKSDARS